MVVAEEKIASVPLPDEVSHSPRRRPGRKTVRRREKIVTAGLVLLIFAAGIVTALYCAQVLILNYQIYRLEQELALVRSETGALYDEVSRLTSLDRIEQVAVNKLGMVKPGVDDVVVVRMDGQKPPAESNSGAAVSVPEVRAEKNSGRGSTGVPADGNRLISAFVDLMQGIRRD